MINEHFDHYEDNMVLFSLLCHDDAMKIELVHKKEYKLLIAMLDKFFGSEASIKSSLPNFANTSFGKRRAELLGDCQD
jgi:hypothetical protein